MPRIPLPPELGDDAFSLGAGRAAGLGDRRLRGSDLSAPFRGVRVAGEADGSVLGRARALATVLPAHVIYFGVTAARVWPLDLPFEPEDEPLHLAVRAPRRPPRRAGCVGHEVVDPEVSALTRGGLRVVDAASMFCQLGAVLDLADLVAVGDQLVRDPPVLDPADPRPWLPLDALRARVESYRFGREHLRAAMGLVRVGAESRQESRLRVALIAAGLPEPEITVDVRSADGRFVARVDLFYRAYGMVIEYQGDIRRSRARYAADLARLDDLAALGLRVVQIGASFATSPDASLARVRRALIERGWPAESAAGIQGSLSAPRGPGNNGK